MHRVIPSTTLYYKPCARHFPVLLCTTKLTQGTSQYYLALQTPQSTLNSPQITLHTPHFTHCTPHSTLHTSHSTLHTAHCTLHTPHFTISTLHTPRSTLHTLQGLICWGLRLRTHWACRFESEASSLHLLVAKLCPLAHHRD